MALVVVVAPEQLVTLPLIMLVETAASV